MNSALSSHHIAEAVEYVPIFLEPLLEETESKAEFLRELSLIAQGEPVMLMEEDIDRAPLLIAFTVLRTLCPEVAFQTRTGQEVLVTDLQIRTPIRPSTLIMDLLDSSPEREAPERSSTDLTLGLADLFPYSLQKGSEIDAVRRALAPLRANPPTAQRITLLGSAPPLFLLFLVDLLAGRCQEIWLQKTPDAPNTLVYSNK
jgi:hypothetical protein